MNREEKPKIPTLRELLLIDVQAYFWFLFFGIFILIILATGSIPIPEDAKITTKIMIWTIPFVFIIYPFVNVIKEQWKLKLINK